MKKNIIIALLFGLQFYNFNAFSQLNTNKISIYTFKTNNIVSNEFKKELEIFYTINSYANYVFLNFNADNCDNVRYGCPILYGDRNYITSKEYVKGILYYQNKIVYLVADSNVVCKFSLFFEKKNDTIINFNLNNSYSNNNVAVFDDSGAYFYWMNVLEKDSILVKIPVAEPIKEYELSMYAKKRWFPFTKKLKIPSKRIEYKRKSDKTQQLIYFVYEIEKGVPVYFYTFYSMDEGNTDKLVNLILKNFNNSKKLKREKYLGKAYTEGKYLIIDYTYLNYIR